jgi:hypothetical protein
MNRVQLPRLIRVLSLDRRAEVLVELEKASSPGIDYFLLVILSCSIASFGFASCDHRSHAGCPSDVTHSGFVTSLCRW